jgi:hypothetical protein
VIYDAWSDAMKTIASASSSGRPRGFQVEGDPQGGWVIVTCIPGVRRRKGQLDLQKYRDILSAAGFNVADSPHVSGVLRVTFPPEAGKV